MNFIHKNKFPLLIFIISLIFAISSYDKGTILSGWDTLHPEFNLPEYIGRIFFGVWQQHQGVGALASQAHASEITRMLIYAPLAVILPLNLVRYFYFFMTLVVGAMGAYFFAKKILFKKEGISYEVASLGTSLFYLLNLAVLQQYYVPLEMFATHFATLPWIFLYAKKALDSERNALIIFGIFTFFSTSISHTSTLWYAFMMVFVIFLFSYSALSKSRKILQRSILIILITVIINAFWLFPNVYFILTQGNNVSISKIHSLFTEEAFAQNEAFGTIPDLLIFKNFLFNWGEYVGNNQFGPLLNEWTTHLSLPFVTTLGYLFSFVSITGILYSIKKKNKFSMALIPVLIISCFFWLNSNPPLGFIFNFLQDHVPFFKEAVRFPFTKISIILVFAFSLYFGWGIVFIQEQVQKVKKNNIFPYFLLILLLASFSYYMFPALKGNLISPSMKVKIPQEYFDMFKWFDNKPQGRVATLPINSFWGWQYYSWGYQGAGFIWFGIKQPIMDREFDRWNYLNEGYYWEMSQAVYTQDSTLFKSVIRKYDIRYIMVDHNVIAPGPGSNGDVLFYSQIEKLLKAEPNIKLVKKFGNIFVYDVSQSVDTSKFTYLLNNPISIGPSYRMAFQDNAYLKYGDYITDSNNSINYPLRTLSDNQNHFIADAKFTQDGAEISLNSMPSASFSYPNAQISENFIPADVLISRNGSSLQTYFYPKTPLNNAPAPIIINSPYPSDGKAIVNINQTDNFIIDSIPQQGSLSLGRVILNTKSLNKVSLYPQKQDITILPDFANIKFSVDSCGQFKTSPVFGINKTSGNSFSVFTKGTQACVTIPLKNIFPNPDQFIKSGDQDLLNVSFNFSGGKNPNLCITEIDNGSCMFYFSKNINTAFSQEKSFTQNLGITELDFDKLAVKIFLDPPYDDSTKTYTYSDMRFSLTGSDLSTNIEFFDIARSIYETSQITQKQTITIPFSGNDNLSRDITQIPKTEGDCPVLVPRGGTPDEKNIVRSESSQYIRYSSDDGSFCDHFSYQNLPQNQGYLIRITSRNIKGLPIRLCVTNSISKRCDIYTHLTKSHDFADETFILPPMNEGTGFDININNFAVKRIPSVNDLKSIEVIPLPYNYLTNIQSGEANTSSTREGLSETQQLNQSLYYVNLSIKDADKVLVLSQGFNEGWTAYSVPSSNILTQLFPFLFGKELKTHVLVNNWANGWKLSGNENGVIIVYLPQYLEYMGFILLICMLATFGIKYKKQLKSPKS